MKTYFRIIAAILGVSFVAGIIMLIIYVSGSRTTAEFIGGIIGIVIAIFVGPAECFLFLKVADLLETQEKVEKGLYSNSSFFKEDATSFTFFKSFEVIKEIESLEKKPLVEGQTGIIEGETEKCYKCILYVKDKKISLTFNKDEPGIKVFDCVRTNRDLITPKGDVVDAQKVGFIKRTINGNDKLAVFNEGTDSEVSVLIEKTYLKS